MIKTKDITLVDDGNELEFRITAMPASEKESWMIRAVLLLTGKAFSDGIDEVAKAFSGDDDTKRLAGIFKLFSGVEYEKMKPLYDQLIYGGKVERIMHGADNREVVQPVSEKTIDGYVSDPRTLFKLRMEAFKLNFAFFGNAAA